MIEPIYYTRDIEGNYHPTADLAAHDAKVREPLEKRIEFLEYQCEILKSQRDAYQREQPTHDARIRREALEDAVRRFDGLCKSTPETFGPFLQNAIRLCILGPAPENENRETK